MLKKQIYRKPGVVYWSAGELNKIEASMSGGVGYVEPPGLHITAANYNGKTISITYRVLQDDLIDRLNMTYQIGYEYAGAYNMCNPDRGQEVDMTVGTHTMTLSPANYNCGIRLWIALINDSGTISQKYTTRWSFLETIYLPKVVEHTVTGTEEWGTKMVEAVTSIGISIATGGLGDKVILGIIVGVMSYASTEVLFSTTIIGPEPEKGQYYRIKQYCYGAYRYIETQMWNKYESYLKDVSPDYSKTVKYAVPRF